MPRALITDIDGTLTDDRRRLSTEAVDELRRIIDAEIPVILASGNTLCFLDAFSHMIGTDGTIIAENGGVYRLGYSAKNISPAIRRSALPRIRRSWTNSGRKAMICGFSAADTGTRTSRFPGMLRPL